MLLIISWKRRESINVALSDSQEISRLNFSWSLIVWRHISFITFVSYEADDSYQEMDSMYASSMAAQYCQPYLVRMYALPYCITYSVELV